VAPLGLLIGLAGAYLVISNLRDETAEDLPLAAVSPDAARPPDAAAAAVARATSDTFPAIDAQPTLARNRVEDQPGAKPVRRDDRPEPTTRPHRPQPTSRRAALPRLARQGDVTKTRSRDPRRSLSGLQRTLDSLTDRRSGDRRETAARRRQPRQEDSERSGIERPPREPPRPATISAPLSSPSKGQVIIKSDPWAYIYVDGRPSKRTTSARPFSLPAGTRQIELVNPVLSLRKSLTIEVAPDQMVRRFVRLKE